MWFDPAQLAKAITRPPATFATSATFQAQKPMQGPKVAIVAKVASLEILASRPDAVAADPFEYPPKTSTSADIAQAEPEPASTCSTCAHRPPGWLSIQPAPCGNHVAAGLSDLEGVIRYHPNNGANCATWKALT